MELANISESITESRAINYQVVDGTAKIYQIFFPQCTILDLMKSRESEGLTLNIKLQTTDKSVEWGQEGF